MKEKLIKPYGLLWKIFRLPIDSSNLTDFSQHRTQKWHWIRWLLFYPTTGYYGRKTNTKRTAKYVYNHVVNPMLLIYLIRAIPIEDKLLAQAEKAFLTGNTMMQTSGTIRKVVPWSEIYKALWGEKKLSRAVSRKHKQNFRKKYPEPIRHKDYSKKKH